MKGVVPHIRREAKGNKRIPKPLPAHIEPPINTYTHTHTHTHTQRAQSPSQQHLPQVQMNPDEVFN